MYKNEVDIIRQLNRDIRDAKRERKILKKYMKECPKHPKGIHAAKEILIVQGHIDSYRKQRTSIMEKIPIGNHIYRYDDKEWEMLNFGVTVEQERLYRKAQFRWCRTDNKNYEKFKQHHDAQPLRGVFPYDLLWFKHCGDKEELKRHGYYKNR